MTPVARTRVPSRTSIRTGGIVILLGNSQQALPGQAAAGEAVRKQDRETGRGEAVKSGGATPPTVGNAPTDVANLKEGQTVLEGYLAYEDAVQGNRRHRLALASDDPVVIAEIGIHVQGKTVGRNPTRDVYADGRDFTARCVHALQRKRPRSTRRFAGT